MALSVKLGNLRANLKVRKEIANAQFSTAMTRVRTSSVFTLPVALAFVFMLAALARPASADMVDLNATISPIIGSVVALIPSIVELVVAIVPAIIVMSVVGFIVGFLDKILGMLKI